MKIMRTFQCAALLAAIVSVAVASEQRDRKLSADAKKAIARFTKIMEIDYENEAVHRGGPPPIGIGHQALVTWPKRRSEIALRFARKVALPRSKDRLVDYVEHYPPADLARFVALHDKKLVDQSPEEKAELDKLFSMFMDGVEKIEDAVLREIPASKFPTFD
jgi:hypothetical protein